MFWSNEAMSNEKHPQGCSLDDGENIGKYKNTHEFLRNRRAQHTEWLELSLPTQLSHIYGMGILKPWAFIVSRKVSARLLKPGYSESSTTPSVSQGSAYQRRPWGNWVYTQKKLYGQELNYGCKMSHLLQYKVAQIWQFPFMTSWQIEFL